MSSLTASYFWSLLIPLLIQPVPPGDLAAEDSILPLRMEGQKKQEKPQPQFWPRTPEMMQQEMRYRVEIEHRKSEQEKALKAANDILALARRLKESGKGTDMQRSLRTIEKLARRILSFGGGKDRQQESRNPPSDIVNGADQIIKLAGALRQSLELLDHRVISVEIIDDSCAIIHLSDHLRRRPISDGL